MMQMVDTTDKPSDIDNGVYDGNTFSSSSEKQQILSDDLPPLETVREMIKYETSLRLSESVQQLFDLYHTNDNAITSVDFFLVLF
jgi:hypothetical protein